MGEHETQEPTPVVTPEATTTPEESAQAEPKAETAEESPSVAADEVVEPEIIELEPPSEAEVLKKKLDQVNAKLRLVSKAYTDLQSEMDAFRTRMQAQSKIQLEKRSGELARTFLEPVQNLQRSIDFPGDNVQGLVEGLKMVHTQFWTALTNLGLEPVPGEGSLFNPTYHEALTQQPVTDKNLDGKVLHVINIGFMVKGKVIQAAQVVVGKYTEPTEA